MTRKSTPPYPSRNLHLWARKMYEFLTDRGLGDAEVLPQTIALQHQIPGDRYIAVEKGLVMYDPSTGYPVMSTGTEWAGIAGGGTDDVLANTRQYLNKISKWLVEQGSVVTNGSGVATVTFSRTFSNPPKISPVVFDPTNGYNVTVQAVSTTQATLATFTSAGAAVAATVHWEASGYWDGIS